MGHQHQSVFIDFILLVNLRMTERRVNFDIHKAESYDLNGNNKTNVGICAFSGWNS